MTVSTLIRLVKAHAYGNDFLLAPALPPGRDPADLTRRACERHRGVGADGLIVVTEQAKGASVEIWNADGSRPEVSGNGVRCVAAWLADRRGLAPGHTVVIDTDAGPKRLTLVARTPDGTVFRAAMGAPRDIQRRTLEVSGTAVEVVTLNVGNPQCVVLGPATAERLARWGSALATHPAFPDGTNVELASVEAPDRVRILIWERGVGPTESSGTGTCAAAVAAASFGGAARTLDVAAPGGVQHVEWTDEGLWLTGAARIVADVDWHVVA